MTLSKKSVIVYLLIGIAPLILVTILFINFTLGVIQSNALASADYQLRHIAEILNSESRNILNLVYDSVADSELNRSFYNFNKGTDTEYMASKIADRFRYYLSLNEYISECVYVSAGDHYILEQNYHADGDQSRWSSGEFRRRSWELVRSANGPVVAAAGEITGRYDAEPAYYIGIQIVSSKTVIGEVFFGISKEIFRDSSFVEMDTMDENVPELLQSTQLLLVSGGGHGYLRYGSFHDRSGTDTIYRKVQTGRQRIHPQSVFCGTDGVCPQRLCSGKLFFPGRAGDPSLDFSVYLHLRGSHCLSVYSAGAASEKADCFGSGGNRQFPRV